jgi:hypothetical protein
MTLYIHPENQKLLWAAIQTSPLFHQQIDNAEWFKGVIEKFYSKCQEDITTDKLKELNMDTIVYMVRELRSKFKEIPKTNDNQETFQEFRNVGKMTEDTYPPASSQYTSDEDNDKNVIYNPNPNWLTPPRHDSMVHFPIQNSYEPSLQSHPGVEYGSFSALGKEHHRPPNFPTTKELPGLDATRVDWEISKNTDIHQNVAIPSYEHEIEPRRKRNDEITEYRQGNLNPLHTPVITKCLNIDTRFRDNLYTTSSTNFTFNLPAPLKKVISMQLTAYELPVTFYGISSSYGNNFMFINCTFQYPLMTSESVEQIKILIPDGNYSASDLVTLINSQLRPLAADGSLVNQAIDGTNNQSIFNCVQFTFDITNSGSGSAKMSLGLQDAPGFPYSQNISSIEMDFTLDIDGNPDTTSITSKFGWNLGFIHPQYLNAKTYTADTLPEPASMRYVYMVVDDFNNNVNNSFVAAFNNYILNNNILARIPVNAQYFNILMENDLSQHTEPRRYFGPVDIYKIQIQLLDDHGRILDINKANYSLCLTFKMLNE